MQKNFLVKTAEFAKICNTTKETIFHYDEIGLLKPCHVSENGYRYYALSQSDQFFAVRELKNLGLSLKEIKNKIKTESPLQYDSLLGTITEELDKKILHLKQCRQTLMHIKNSLHTYLTMKKNNTSPCFLTEIPKSCHIKIPSEKTQQPFEYVDAYLKLLQQNPSFIKNCPYIAGTMKNSEDADNPLACEYYYFRKPCTQNANFPKTAVLSAFHDSNYEEISRTYGILRDYAQKHGICLGTQYYEEILFNPLNTKENSFIIQIMAKIA